MWQVFDDTVQKEMIGAKGRLKRGWSKYSVMDIRESS